MLLTSYGANNRVIESDLAVTYSRKLIYGSWSYASGTSIVTLNSAWAYTRTASKHYKYVGMTHAAAIACAAALRTLYTRTTKVSEFDGPEFSEVSGGNIQMAEISVDHVEGQMYEVVVNVTESDERLRMTAVSASSLFTDEDARDYDTASSSSSSS